PARLIGSRGSSGATLRTNSGRALVRQREPELNNAVAVSAEDQSGIRVRGSTVAGIGKRCVRIVEIEMVESIEEVRPEFQVHALRHRERLLCAYVPVGIARAK